MNGLLRSPAQGCAHEQLHLADSGAVYPFVMCMAMVLKHACQVVMPLRVYDAHATKSCVSTCLPVQSGCKYHMHAPRSCSTFPLTCQAPSRIAAQPPHYAGPAAGPRRAATDASLALATCGATPGAAGRVASGAAPRAAAAPGAAPGAAAAPARPRAACRLCRGAAAAPWPPPVCPWFPSLRARAPRSTSKRWSRPR